MDEEGEQLSGSNNMETEAVQNVQYRRERDQVRK